MNILVLGGTRLMGKHLVASLLLQGHQVTIATRGLTPDEFGVQVKRLVLDRSNKESIEASLGGQVYDVVYDNLCYCSNDVKILMDVVSCQHYIQVSTVSVYENFHLDIKEEEFNANMKSLVYCNREEYFYGEVKRLAECAVVQDYPDVLTTRIRFPFILGQEDYTQRLYFYVDHILNEKAMFVDNPTSEIAAVNSVEAGAFLAYLATHPYQGALNVASIGTFTIQRINQVVKNLAGKSMILDKTGDCAPYNGAVSFSLDISQAQATGYEFSHLDDWFDNLIKYYIQLHDESKRRN